MLTVLSLGTKDTPVWIPAELCTVMAGQAYHGVLDGDQTTRMLKIAARPPAENASRIVAADGGLGQIGVLPSRRENLVRPPISALEGDLGVRRLIVCCRLPLD